MKAELKKFGVELLPTAGIGAMQLALFEETGRSQTVGTDLHYRLSG